MMNIMIILRMLMLLLALSKLSQVDQGERQWLLVKADVEPEVVYSNLFDPSVINQGEHVGTCSYYKAICNLCR